MCSSSISAWMSIEEQQSAFLQHFSLFLQSASTFGFHSKAANWPQQKWICTCTPIAPMRYSARMAMIFHFCMPQRYNRKRLTPFKTNQFFESQWPISSGALGKSLRCALAFEQLWHGNHQRVQMLFSGRNRIWSSVRFHLGAPIFCCHLRG